MEHLIENEGERKRVVASIGRHSLPFRVAIKDGRHRSLDQNRLQWLWAGEAAAARRDVSPEYVQREWKLAHAVPLLVAENETFATFWAEVAAATTWEQQVEFMRFISITSVMSTAAMKQFLDDVYQTNTEYGIELSNPEDLRWGKP